MLQGQVDTLKAGFYRTDVVQFKLSNLWEANAS